MIKWFERCIGQYFNIFFLAEFYLSREKWLMIYKYKGKKSKILKVRNPQF